MTARDPVGDAHDLRPWSSLANPGAATGVSRTDTLLFAEPGPYEDFEYSTGLDFASFGAHMIGSSTGSSLTRPFSPFHANLPGSNSFASPPPPPPRSRTSFSFATGPETAAAAPLSTAAAPDPAAPLFDSTESALFSTFLTTLDVDPGFLFNPVLPPGMPSPPSTIASPYHEQGDRERRERDSLGREVGNMTLRSTNAAGASSTTRSAGTPRSSSSSSRTATGGAAAPQMGSTGGSTGTPFRPPSAPSFVGIGASPSPRRVPAPPTTLTAGPPPPPLSLRAPSPPGPALQDEDDPFATGRGRGTGPAVRDPNPGVQYAEDERRGQAAAEEEGEEEDDTARDSDPDFEPQARGSGAGGRGGLGWGAGASASAGARRRARTSGRGGVAPAAGTARGKKKARVAEPRQQEETGTEAAEEEDTEDVEMAPPALVSVDEKKPDGPAGRAKREAASIRRGGGLSARPSLSRNALPARGETNAHAIHGDGQDGADDWTEASGPGARTATLSESQKRSNHILSEQKRRNAIRVGFKDLVGLLVAGEDASGIVLSGAGPGGGGGDEDDEGPTGAGTKKRKARGSGRGRGRRGDVSTNASKSVVLTQAASYILWLERGNAALEHEVARVEGLLRDARVVDG